MMQGVSKPLLTTLSTEITAVTKFAIKKMQQEKQIRGALIGLDDQHEYLLKDISQTIA